MNNPSSIPLVLIISNPRLLGEFLSNRESRLHAGIEVPLVLWVRPSMKFVDRLHDLRRTVLRRSRITGISPWMQLCHHFVWRCVSRAAQTASADMDDSSVEDALRQHHEVRIVRTVNSPEAMAALTERRFALGVVVGGDVFSSRTLRRVDMPLYNIHLSDPQFVRGKPPIFWEVLEGRGEMKLTLHRVVLQLDAGPVIWQRAVPVEWDSTLIGTMRRTRRTLAHHIAELLFDALPAILDESAVARYVTPGPLRTVPTTSQILRAHRVCARHGRASF